MKLNLPVNQDNYKGILDHLSKALSSEGKFEIVLQKIKPEIKAPKKIDNTIELTKSNISIVKDCLNKFYQLDGYSVKFIKTTNKRTLIQNAKIHAMCGDFVKCKITHDGKERDLEYWKRILTIGWLTAEGESPEIATNPYNGEIVVFWLHTSKMTTKQLASLTEYVYSYGAEKDVIWSEKTKEFGE